MKHEKTIIGVGSCKFLIGENTELKYLIVNFYGTVAVSDVLYIFGGFDPDASSLADGGMFFADQPIGSVADVDGNIDSRVRRITYDLYKEQLKTTQGQFEVYFSVFATNGDMETKITLITDR